MKTLCIVTPAYNAEKYIDETIRSVVFQDCRSHITYHIQDGGSTDGTQDILQKWDKVLRGRENVSFSHVSEPDSGMYDAIQKGVERLSIPEDAFFSWINADDILCDGALAAVEAVSGMPEIDWVYGRVSRMAATGSLIDEGECLFPRRLVGGGLADGLIWSCMQQEGMFFRKRLWDKAGGVNTSFRLAGDWDLWRRMARHAAPVFLDSALARFRLHPGQLTDNLAAYFQEIDSVLSSGERRRAMRSWCITSFEGAPAVGSNGMMTMRPIMVKERLRCLLLAFGMRRMVFFIQKILAGARLRQASETTRCDTMFNKVRGAVRKILLPPLMRFAFGRNIGAFKTNAASRYMSFEQTFSAIQMLGVSVRTIVDVGASNGCWSERAAPFFADARYLLIEANPVHEPELKKLCAGDARYEYALAAAGEQPGKIFFDLKDPFSGKAREEALDAEDVCLPATTIDCEIERRGLTGPYLVKLDTHGFEVPILHGARKALSEASIVIIEAYAFQLSPECLKFYDMCRFMAERGFEVFDICTPMWREKDNALWQVDLVFLRSTLPVFKDAAYL